VDYCTVYSPIDVEQCEMAWEHIDQNLLKWRSEFNKRLDVEQGLEDIKQINRNLDRLVEYEKRNAANTTIIAKHLGLIACAIGIYIVARILEIIFQ
jgi:hypothetical protein